MENIVKKKTALLLLLSELNLDTERLDIAKVVYRINWKQEKNRPLIKVFPAWFNTNKFEWQPIYVCETSISWQWSNWNLRNGNCQFWYPALNLILFGSKYLHLKYHECVISSLCQKCAPVSSKSWIELNSIFNSKSFYWLFFIPITKVYVSF